MTNVKNKTKYLYLEYLRIISIFFVIFNHTDTVGFMMFIKKNPRSIKFWLEMFLSIGCKFAVPVFFMISGFLLFKKDYTNKQIMNKIFKILASLIVFSFVYYLSSVFVDKNPFDILDFIKNLLTCRISVHFWYLYMYIFLLLSYPILHLIIDCLNEKIINYMIIIHIVINGIIPILYYMLFQEQFITNDFVTPFWCIDTIIIYPCIGYYLGSGFKLGITSKLKKLWIINIFLILVSCVMTYVLYRVKCGLADDMSSQIFYNCFVLINAITIFVSIKSLFERINYNKVIVFFGNLGKYVFGIYLLHPLIKIFNSYIFIYGYVKYHYFSSILLLITIVIYMFLYSFVITYILSKIPYIKKLVGFR